MLQNTHIFYVTFDTQITCQQTLTQLIKGFMLFCFDIPGAANSCFLFVFCFFVCIQCCDEDETQTGHGLPERLRKMSFLTGSTATGLTSNPINLAKFKDHIIQLLETPQWDVIRFCSQLLCHHTGTVAFGSNHGI